MEGNDEITFASIEKHKEPLIDENLKPHPDCCIYKVPKALRKINEEAYTPQVISIGPLHYGKQNLAYMEKQKRRYKREFSDRIPPHIWQEFVNFIQNHEQRIRNCYEDTSNLRQKLEFVAMILYDAVFIIEFFLRNFEAYNGKRTPPCTPILTIDIWLDLLLLENQLPYFLLEKLYMIAFPNHPDYPPFLKLSCRFFNLSNAEVEVKHFTDLKRHVLTKTYSRPRSKLSISDLPCAIKLQESGVKFKHVDGECLLNVNFEKKKRRIPFQWLKVHELQLPKLIIEDLTESLFRNLMALEQCHYPSETHVCNYVYLLDALIDTEEDVKLLVEAGIIFNYGGDSTKVANMFNKLGENIILDGYCYCNILKDLKAHYENPWHHTVAALKRVYFSNLWRGTGTVAAIVLLLLTLIQTVCSILQVV